MDVDVVEEEWDQVVFVVENGTRRGDDALPKVLETLLVRKAVIDCRPWTRAHFSLQPVVKIGRALRTVSVSLRGVAKSTSGSRVARASLTQVDRPYPQRTLDGQSTLNEVLGRVGTSPKRRRWGS